MRRKFLKWLAGAAIAGSISIGIPVAGADATVLERILETGELRVGTSAGQPPFSFKNRYGETMGMDIDLARLLARSMNVELELVERPFGDLLSTLAAGEVDLVLSGVTATLRRNMQAAFVGPYFVTGKSIVARAETVSAIQNQSDLARDVRVAALRGSTSESFVRAAVPEANVRITDNYDGAIDLLLSNEVDAIVADAPICQLLVQRWPDSGLVRSSQPLTLEPIGIAVRPDDALFVNLVKNFLGALSATGALDQLHEKWFKNGDWLAELP